MSTSIGYTYTGIWTNWSRGPLFGATLTLTSRSASYLNSSLGVFITLVGTQFWTILSFAIHQLNADLKSDTLQRQSQIILRNTGTAAGAAWSFICLPFYWRKREASGFSKFFPPWKTLIRSWLTALPALLTFAFFVAAGTLSSQINKAVGTETLMYGPNCGQWTIQGDLSDVTDRALVSKILNESFIAANYARYCYGAASTSSLCNTYVHQEVKWTADQNASCPFADDICVFGNTAALQLDTGYVDSHWVLGINSPVTDRILYRRVTTCAPLNSTGRITQRDDSFEYNFGFYLEAPDVTMTYYTDLLYHGLEFYLQEYAPGFYGWVPIPALNCTNADVSLFAFAPNIVGFLGPVDDPFFAATWEQSLPNQPVWQAKDESEYVHFLACADQHQFCNPNKANSPNNSHSCTELTSVSALNSSVDSISWTPRQYAILNLILSALEYSPMFFSTAGRGSAALLASEKIFGDIADILPNNQWMIEVSNWFAISLARLQHGLVEFATGPSTLPPGMTVIPPSDSESKALCHAQKVRDTGTHQNFSVFGLAFTLAVGIFIILTSLTLEWIVGVVRKRFTNDPRRRRLQWILDGNMQLLRMVHEYADMGAWVNTHKQVPITEERVSTDEEDPVVTSEKGRNFFQLPDDMEADKPGWKSTKEEAVVKSVAGYASPSPLPNDHLDGSNNYSLSSSASSEDIENGSLIPVPPPLPPQQPALQYVSPHSRHSELNSTQLGQSAVRNVSEDPSPLPPHVIDDNTTYVPDGVFDRENISEVLREDPPHRTLSTPEASQCAKISKRTSTGGLD